MKLKSPGIIGIDYAIISLMHTEVCWVKLNSPCIIGIDYAIISFTNTKAIIITIYKQRNMYMKKNDVHHIAQVVKNRHILTNPVKKEKKKPHSLSQQDPNQSTKSIKVLSFLLYTFQP